MPLRWFLVPALLAAAAILLGEATDIDRAVVHLFYDPVSASFPLRRAFWLDVVMHHWAKYLVASIGCFVIAGYAASYAHPRLRTARRTLLFLALALTLAPLSVTVGKAMSARHCPWDIEDFGGRIPYTASQPGMPQAPPGHCFPAGHASTGFALLGFYFAAHAARRRRAARWSLALGLGAGIVLGIGRVAQGAHFPSHVVWAGLISWFVMVGLYFCVMRVSRAKAA